MREIIIAISCLLIFGCASQPKQTTLTLFFSPEQVSLTAEQQRKISDFLADNPYHQLAAKVAPADLANPFDALLQSQKRIQAVSSLSNSQNIPLHLEYAPNQTADTLILQRQSP
ncbi:hypothetical protein ACQKPX_22415 [Photobacterium sp. DNB23_23_1]|uniref:Uncharacterized protein n=1 Tax=Photobacterium pectinilyticum TaxID=2906793 RepID=A0ABT1N585_9GAMM|nr:hypothetical protein [Photobacterium sp. ZSDE20]MCQ1059913.1 hypothetical protein [Photobacterium sp. ZSDE20]MDD1826506.1 hypothetical protein [Photobacterium sp. ZSDE20]